jgi:hypothetical protein
MLLWTQERKKRLVTNFQRLVPGTVLLVTFCLVFTTEHGHNDLILLQKPLTAEDA